jgi:hypothetical protein
MDTGLNPFTEYMLFFYGTSPDAIYPEYQFRQAEIERATRLYRTQIQAGVYPGRTFEGDGVDRERVRDLIVAARAAQSRE